MAFVAKYVHFVPSTLIPFTMLWLSLNHVKECGRCVCVCVHQIPCLLTIKRRSSVVFVGVDTLDDIRNNSYIELFVSGGCIISDESILSPGFISHGGSEIHTRRQPVLFLPCTHQTVEVLMDEMLCPAAQLDRLLKFLEQNSSLESVWKWKIHHKTYRKLKEQARY